MFQESLIESTPLLRSRNRWPALISFTVQAIIATAIVAIPILHPEVIPLRTPKLAFIAPPLPRPIPPTPPPQLQRVRMASTANILPSAPAPTAPRLFPSLAPSTDLSEAPNFNPTSISMSGPGIPSSILDPTNSSTRVVPAPTTTGRPGPPARVSDGVTAGHLISPIHPTYPPIAIASRQQGTVVVEAIISKSGQIESAHVTSGPIMLQNAALDAVRQARYRPFLLSGEPTEVQTTISVNFRLGPS